MTVEAFVRLVEYTARERQRIDRRAGHLPTDPAFPRSIHDRRRSRFIWRPCRTAHSSSRGEQGLRGDANRAGKQRSLDLTDLVLPASTRTVLITGISGKRPSRVAGCRCHGQCFQCRQRLKRRRARDYRARRDVPGFHPCRAIPHRGLSLHSGGRKRKIPKPGVPPFQASTTVANHSRSRCRTSVARTNPRRPSRDSTDRVFSPRPRAHPRTYAARMSQGRKSSLLIFVGLSRTAGPGSQLRNSSRPPRQPSLTLAAQRDLRLASHAKVVRREREGGRSTATSLRPTHISA